MNDGFLTLLIGVILLFILFGGWFHREIETENWNTTVIGLILLIFMVAPFFPITLWGITITPVMPLLLFISSYFILQKAKPQRFQLTSASLLVGVVLFLMEEMFRLDPVILIMDARMLMGALLAVLTGVITTSLTEKWLIAMLGMPLGWIFYHTYHHAEIVQKELGLFYSVDGLFFALISISTMHICFGWLNERINKIRERLNM